MNDLLFYTLLALLLYYFFYYLPQPKSPTLLKPITLEKTTQTETELSPDPEEITKLQDQNQELLKDQAQLEKSLDQLIKAINQLSQELC